MRVIWDDTGEEEEIKPGCMMVGRGIREVTSITFKDFTDFQGNLQPNFHEWFIECFLTRMVPQKEITDGKG